MSINRARQCNKAIHLGYKHRFLKTIFKINFVPRTRSQDEKIFNQYSFNFLPFLVDFFIVIKKFKKIFLSSFPDTVLDHMAKENVKIPN
jgi:hypothetical protein